MTALLTPFGRKGEVSESALSDLVSFQIARGTEGLFPCGTTGLGPMLRTEERKRVAEVVINENSGKVPVVVQVGSADTCSTMELAKHAEKVGADAVASLTPYYYKPGDAAVIKHFEAVARLVSIPLFAYNIPQFTGNNLQPSVISRMARAGTIAGVKDSSRDFLHLQEIIRTAPDGFMTMNGTEEYGLFALMVGADGLVSGGANAFPEALKGVVEALRDGEYDRAFAAHRKVIRIKEAVSAAPIGAYYEVLRQRGIECGAPRPPMLPLKGAAKTRLKKSLSAIDAW